MLLATALLKSRHRIARRRHTVKGPRGKDKLEFQFAVMGGTRGSPTKIFLMNGTTGRIARIHTVDQLHDDWEPFHEMRDTRKIGIQKPPKPKYKPHWPPRKPPKVPPEPMPPCLKCEKWPARSHANPYCNSCHYGQVREDNAEKQRLALEQMRKREPAEVSDWRLP